MSDKSVWTPLGNIPHKSWHGMARIKLVVITVLLAANLATGASLIVDQAKSQLMVELRKAQYKFTPGVREAYLNYQREVTKDALKAQNMNISAKFQKWVEADPVTLATVYGTHEKPGDMLAHLFALGMDMGRDNLEKYRQLALAAAVVSAKRGLPADITRREPVTLNIGGDPRVLVDTKDSTRVLDINDHIINFLNENTIDGFVVNKGNDNLPELIYDDKGVAVPPPVEVVASTGKQKQKRTLYGADVIASAALQQKFNAYMKERGFPVEIECGDQIIHWNASEMVTGEMNKKIDRAYNLFKSAYEEKGLLPKQRDPEPSMGERVAYLIRNHEHKFTATMRQERKWPRFPLTAPWPVMTILLADNQPLREREERWIAFRDHGTFVTYGEYIGSVAQQFNMQSARRVSPYPFTYGSIQMMLKDGGVCGTMGNISARSHITLGVPSCTAGQPGHCAVIMYGYNEKEKFYNCYGGQYATGGDDKTHPHASWFFGDNIKTRQMIYHQSIAYATNYSLEGFIDSIMAYYIFTLMPEKERGEKGFELLRSALSLNPYSFLVSETLWKQANDPTTTINAWSEFEALLIAAKTKHGCPSDGLYKDSVMAGMFERIKQLPVPTDKIAGRKILRFLEERGCDVPELLAGYRFMLDGLPTLLRETEKTFKEHLVEMQTKASNDNEDKADKMARMLKSVAEFMRERSIQRRWAASMLELAKGQEVYYNRDYSVILHPAITAMAELADQKIPTETELMAPVIKRLTADLDDSVKHARTDESTKKLATKIEAIFNSIKSATVKRNLINALAPVIKGKESFKQKGANRSQRDPCADMIDKLRASGEIN